MKPAAFDYLRPASLAEALQALARHGAQGRILAGGQSLVPMMNLRLLKPATLIDINRLPDLDGIRVEGNELVIGALARHADLLASPLVAKHCPLMAEAYPCVAHGPIRNRGTLAGNISHADPASEMPAVITACNATIIAANTKGTRKIAAESFFTGPLSTALKPGEMVTEIRVPCAPANQGWSWQEEAYRQGDFAMAGIGVTLIMAGGKCTQASIAVAGMQRPAVRLAKLEKQLVGQAIDDARITASAKLARESVEPGDSYHADPTYRRELVEVLAVRALRAARSRCK